MAHEIMNETAFLGVEKAGWHGLGEVIDTPITAMEALERIKANFIIEKRPMVISVNAENPMDFSQVQIIPDQFMLYRGPCELDSAPAFFGTVGKDYEFFQNHEVAGLVDYLASETGWTLETIGALQAGQTLFIALKATMHKVASEDVQLYFVYATTRDGKSSDYIIATPVRVVCRNTLSLSLSKNFGKVTIRHNTGMKSLAAWYVDILAATQKAGNDVINALAKLEKISMDDAKVQKVLDAVFPLMDAPDVADLLNSGNDTLVRRGKNALAAYNVQNSENERAREFVTANLERLDREYPAITGTGWATFQAVTQYVTHQRGKQTDNGSRVRSEQDIFGKGIQTRTAAYNAIMEIGSKKGKK